MIIEQTRLLDERLEHGVGAVRVELDADLGPKFVGQIVQLPPRRNRHYERLGLLVDGEFRNANGIRNRLG